MKAFAAIVRREILERRQILWAAAVAALIPIVLPVFRLRSAHDAADVRGWTSLLIALAFAFGLVVSLGASILVPRVTSRRIAFDLSRPVPAAAIWLGSVAAATILALAAAAIVWIPARLLGARTPWDELVREPSLWGIGLLAAIAGLPVLFAAAHGFRLMLRSRSAWLALDVGLYAACLLGLGAALTRLPQLFASRPRIVCLVGIALVTAAAFLIAGYASVSRGRADVRAAHRALSTVLWGIIVPAVALANAYAAWVLAASPRDLAELWVQPSPNGPWIQLSGTARGADARFLYDTAGGRFVRAQTVDWRGPAFSRDGRWAAWIEGRDRGGPFPVRTLRLDRPDARPAVTRLLLNTSPYLLVLSPDGSRLATWEQDMLSIHDLGSERTLASARVPVGARERLAGVFVGRDAFRVFRIGDMSIDILEFDVATRSLAPRGRVAVPAGLRYVSVDPEGSRLVTVEGPDRRVRLLDAANGSLLATLAETEAGSRWPVFLSERRIVVLENVSKVRSLLVFGPDGSAKRVVRLPPMNSLTIGGEAAPGLLCLGFGDSAYRYTTWTVRLDDGALRQIATDLQPLLTLGRVTPEAGSDGTRLFYGPGQRSLVSLDPVTGKRRTILGPS
jgi:hypothetical protein